MACQDLYLQDKKTTQHKTGQNRQQSRPSTTMLLDYQGSSKPTSATGIFDKFDGMEIYQSESKETRTLWKIEKLWDDFDIKQGIYRDLDYDGLQCSGERHEKTSSTLLLENFDRSFGAHQSSRAHQQTYPEKQKYLFKSFLNEDVDISFKDPLRCRAATLSPLQVADNGEESPRIHKYFRERDSKTLHDKFGSDPVDPYLWPTSTDAAVDQDSESHYSYCEGLGEERFTLEKSEEESPWSVRLHLNKTATTKTKLFADAPTTLDSESPRSPVQAKITVIPSSKKPVSSLTRRGSRTSLLSPRKPRRRRCRSDSRYSSTHSPSELAFNADVLLSAKDASETDLTPSQGSATRDLSAQEESDVSTKTLTPSEFDVEEEKEEEGVELEKGNEEEKEREKDASGCLKLMGLRCPETVATHENRPEARAARFSHTVIEIPPEATVDEMLAADDKTPDDDTDDEEGRDGSQYYSAASSLKSAVGSSAGSKSDADEDSSREATAALVDALYRQSCQSFSLDTPPLSSQAREEATLSKDSVAEKRTDTLQSFPDSRQTKHSQTKADDKEIGYSYSFSEKDTGFSKDENCIFTSSSKVAATRLHDPQPCKASSQSAKTKRPWWATDPEELSEEEDDLDETSRSCCRNPTAVYNPTRDLKNTSEEKGRLPVPSDTFEERKTCMKSACEEKSPQEGLKSTAGSRVGSGPDTLKEMCRKVLTADGLDFSQYCGFNLSHAYFEAFRARVAARLRHVGPKKPSSTSPKFQDGKRVKQRGKQEPEKERRGIAARFPSLEQRLSCSAAEVSKSTSGSKSMATRLQESQTCSSKVQGASVEDDSDVDELLSDIANINKEKDICLQRNEVSAETGGYIHPTDQEISRDNETRLPILANASEQFEHQAVRNLSEGSLKPVAVAVPRSDASSGVSTKDYQLFHASEASGSWWKDSGVQPLLATADCVQSRKEGPLADRGRDLGNETLVNDDVLLMNAEDESSPSILTPAYYDSPSGQEEFTFPRQPTDTPARASETDDPYSLLLPDRSAKVTERLSSKGYSRPLADFCHFADGSFSETHVQDKSKTFESSWAVNMETVASTTSAVPQEPVISPTRSTDSAKTASSSGQTVKEASSGMKPPSTMRKRYLPVDLLGAGAKERPNRDPKSAASRGTGVSKKVAPIRVSSAFQSAIWLPKYEAPPSETQLSQEEQSTQDRKAASPAGSDIVGLDATGLAQAIDELWSSRCEEGSSTTRPSHTNQWEQDQKSALAECPGGKELESGLKVEDFVDDWPLKGKEIPSTTKLSQGEQWDQNPASSQCPGGEKLDFVGNEEEDHAQFWLSKYEAKSPSSAESSKKDQPKQDDRPPSAGSPHNTKPSAESVVTVRPEQKDLKELPDTESTPEPWPRLTDYKLLRRGLCLPRSLPLRTWADAELESGANPGVEVAWHGTDLPETTTDLESETPLGQQPKTEQLPDESGNYDSLWRNTQRFEKCRQDIKSSIQQLSKDEQTLRATDHYDLVRKPSHLQEPDGSHLWHSLEDLGRGEESPEEEKSSDFSQESDTDEENRVSEFSYDSDTLTYRKEVPATEGEESTDAVMARALRSLPLPGGRGGLRRSTSLQCARQMVPDGAKAPVNHTVEDKCPFIAQTLFQRVLRDIPGRLKPASLKIFEHCTVLETWRAVCCSEPDSGYYCRRIRERPGGDDNSNNIDDQNLDVSRALDECAGIILTQIARVKDWFGSEKVDGLVSPLERRQLGRHLEVTMMVFRMPLHACLKLVPLSFPAEDLRIFWDMTLQDSWAEIYGIRPSSDIYRYFTVVMGCWLHGHQAEDRAALELIRVVLSRLHLFAKASISTRPQSVFSVTPVAPCPLSRQHHPPHPLQAGYPRLSPVQGVFS